MFPTVKELSGLGTRRSLGYSLRNGLGWDKGIIWLGLGSRNGLSWGQGMV